MKYLLDTCIFNWLLDGKYTVADLPHGEYLVTHIQRDEIGKTKNEARREVLLRLLEQISDTQIPTEVFVVGVSRVGQAAVGSGDIYYRVLTELSHRAKRDSNVGDAIIGATAHTGGYGLITADSNFFDVMSPILLPEHLVLWKNGS